MSKVIQIQILCPTHRSYKRLPWKLRDVKEKEMRDVMGAHMSVISSGPVDVVRVVVGGHAAPEDYHVKPLISVLREFGIVTDATALRIESSKKQRYITIIL